MSDYGNCPNCGSPLIKKNSKNGPFLSCSAFPKCRFSMDYNEKTAKGIDLSNISTCPNCGSPLVKKNGRNGPFLSCSAFPKCRFSKDL